MEQKTWEELHKKRRKNSFIFASINPIIQAGITQSQEGTSQLERIPLNPLHFHSSRDQQNWTHGYCWVWGRTGGVPSINQAAGITQFPGSALQTTQAAFLTEGTNSQHNHPLIPADLTILHKHTLLPSVLCLLLQATWIFSSNFLLSCARDQEPYRQSCQTSEDVSARCQLRMPQLTITCSQPLQVYCTLSAWPPFTGLQCCSRLVRTSSHTNIRCQPKLPQLPGCT